MPVTFQEFDIVALRTPVTATVTSDDPREETLPVGTRGTVVRVYENTYEVEFLLPSSDETAMATVPANNVEPSETIIRQQSESNPGITFIRSAVVIWCFFFFLLQPTGDYFRGLNIAILWILGSPILFILGISILVRIVKGKHPDTILIDLVVCIFSLGFPIIGYVILLLKL